MVDINRYSIFSAAGAAAVVANAWINTSDKGPEVFVDNILTSKLSLLVCHILLEYLSINFARPNYKYHSFYRLLFFFTPLQMLVNLTYCLMYLAGKYLTRFFFGKLSDPEYQVHQLETSTVQSHEVVIIFFFFSSSFL
jgi:hypothetical protein